jgi:hypothetical protein
MEAIERIKAEVERLRDTKGISFNEMVCYVEVLRIIDRECKDRLLEGGQWGDLMSKPKYRIDLGRIYTNER